MPRTQSAVFFGRSYIGIRIRLYGPIFNNLFMVRLRVRNILDYDVIIDTCTGVHTKLQTLVRQISPTDFLHPKKVARGWYKNQEGYDPTVIVNGNC